MTKICQKCAKGFEGEGPLCGDCLPKGCDIAGLRALAEAVGIAVREKPFTRQYFFNLAVNSAFNMPTVRIPCGTKISSGSSAYQEILCTNVTTAVWEYEKRVREGNAKKKWNLPLFKTDPTSGS